MRQPTFLLKPCAYKTGKLYAHLPEDGNGDMTMTQHNGNATRVNKYGLIESVATDIPRIDYLDGVGLLLEPTRTNLVTESVDWSAWTDTSAILTANDSVAPDGTYTANSIEDLDGTSTLNNISEVHTVSDATAIHTVSVFVKFDSGSGIRMGVDSDGAGQTTFTQTVFESDGTITVISDASNAIVGSGYQDYGDGWLRFWVAYDMDNTKTGIETSFYPTRLNAEDTGKTFLWGLQIEEGKFPTSYIPTSGSSLQRLYDNFSLQGFDANGILTEGEGAFFVDISSFEVDPDLPTFLVLLGDDTDHRLYIHPDTPDTGGRLEAVIDDATTETRVDLPAATRNKVLFNWSEGTADIWLNGVKSATASNDFYITDSIDLTLSLRGNGTKIKIQELAMWDTKLNDSEAQRVTQ